MRLAIIAVIMVALILCWKLFKARDIEAQTTLAGLERKLHVLIAHIQKNVPDDPRLQRLIYEWDGRLAASAQNVGAGSTADKKHISVCVRSPTTGALEDPAVGLVVAIHELTHVCTESIGHTPEFWKNMRWLLQEAERAGLYTYQNFEESPVTYCGAHINSNPLTCLKDGSCA